MSLKSHSMPVMPVMPAAFLLLWLLPACTLELAQDGSPCSVSSDCKSDSCLRGVCQPAQPGTCLDDAMEPNNERAQAFRVAVDHGYAGLVLCPDDEDWFVVGLSKGTPLVLELSSVGREPPGSLTLRGPEAQTMAEVATYQDSSILRREYSIDQAGDYSIQIAMGRGGTGPYSLLLRGTPEDPEPPRCEDPEDDDPQSATTLTVEQGEFHVQSSLCPGGDEDWWAIQLIAGDYLEAELEGFGGQSVSLELYREAANAGNGGGEGEVEPELVKAGSLEREDLLRLEHVDLGMEPDGASYYLKLSGDGIEEEQDYRLGGSMIPFENDAGEPDNDTALGARQKAEAEGGVPELSTAETLDLDLQIGPGDVDWVVFMLPARHVLVLEGSYDLLEGDLEAVIFDHDEQPLGGGAGRG